MNTRSEYTEQCLQDLLELVEMDPEALDTTKPLFVAVTCAKLALEPDGGRSLIGLPPEGECST